MFKNIRPALKNATTLHHVKKELVKFLEITKNKNGNIKIGYVAGILNSDGPQHFESNRKKLADYAEKLRKIHEFPIFSGVDIFSNEVYSRLEEWRLSLEEKEEKARLFWREILESGHITDIFMTPRWEKSKGANDEHETAKKIGLKIHYVGFDLLTA
ncbi:MAG: DUF4406 domain-containing protein [Candidatus Levybacteria bacterium]|nr:DUF4406 domain-containing protein [Candidatus Levybacteria bacterium]